MSHHRITATIGESLKVDIDYSYEPLTGEDKIDDTYPAELEAIKAIVIGDESFNELNPVYVRELAENWLQDEGYEMAVEHAKRERNE